jgi:hypothetical protein
MVCICWVSACIRRINVRICPKRQAGFLWYCAFWCEIPSVTCIFTKEPYVQICVSSNGAEIRTGQHKSSHVHTGPRSDGADMPTREHNQRRRKRLRQTTLHPCQVLLQIYILTSLSGAVTNLQTDRTVRCCYKFTKLHTIPWKTPYSQNLWNNVIINRNKASKQSHADHACVTAPHGT